MDSRYNKYLRLAENTYFKRLGKVVKIVGLTIESVGPDAKLNDLCRIIIDENADTVVMAEVVGFRYRSRMYRLKYGASFICSCRK